MAAERAVMLYSMECCMAQREKEFPFVIQHGGAFDVAGSCHQLMANSEHSLLVDCGLFQGEDAAKDSFAQL